MERGRRRGRGYARRMAKERSVMWVLWVAMRLGGTLGLRRGVVKEILSGGTAGTDVAPRKRRERIRMLATMHRGRPVDFHRSKRRV